jgi:NAD(P)-dependent dehydrogenase (short-subunit alcohol dehydrogenase family)
VPKKPLSEQVVLVTGASSGLGRAIARGAGERGARVVVTARNAEALDDCVREVEAFGAQALAVPADHAIEGEVHQVVERALDRFGRLDTVVASAMVSVFGEFEQLRMEELRRVLDVNLLARIALLQVVLPHLKETRGTFIDVNSALAYRGIPLQAPYCATKAALRTFLEAVRIEQRKHDTGVDICVVLPGAINTPHFDRVRQRLGFQPQPVPPAYQPEPFAEAVLHCAEHPVRELPVGWGAQKLLWGQKLAPRLADRILERNGWKSQHTQDPKPVDSQDNLFETLPGDPGAHGRFDDRSRESTLWTSLRLRRRLVGGAAVAAAGGAIAALSQRNGHQPRGIRRLVRSR